MTSKQVRAQYTQEFKLEAVWQVKQGQSAAAVGKVLGIPKASLANGAGKWRRVNWTGCQRRCCSAQGHSTANGDRSSARRERTAANGTRYRKKSGGVLRAGCAARYAWIYQMKAVYPVAISCTVLQVSSSGYFHWRRPQQEGKKVSGERCSDAAAVAHIRSIHTEVKGEYGWPRMQKELQAPGIRIGKERVRKLMQQQGIQARSKRKFMVTTDSKHHLPVAPDLVQRRFVPETPNQLGCGDIIYIATDEEWLYLAAVIDMFNRQVVGWIL